MKLHVVHFVTAAISQKMVTSTYGPFGETYNITYLYNTQKYILCYFPALTTETFTLTQLLVHSPQWGTANAETKTPPSILVGAQGYQMPGISEVRPLFLCKPGVGTQPCITYFAFRRSLLAY